MQHFDAMIIGSGQGGTPLAGKLAQSGWKTVLIEKRWLGGTCVNDGCTPTKTMIADAKRAFTVQEVHQFGIGVNYYSIDLQQIVDRKNKVVQASRSRLQKSLENTANLTLVFGEAVFTGDKTVTVTLHEGGHTEQYHADHIFINTGAQPAIPPIDGLKEVPYYTSTTLLDASYIPPHLVVIGAGYVGLELGQLFKRLGSEVTIIEKGPALLPHEDDDIAQAVTQFLQAEGIRIVTNARVTKATAPDSDEVVVSVVQNNKQLQVEGSHLLVASGRVPQTAKLNPHAAGIETDEKGFIKVNEYLETNVPGIYALGDVKPGPAFTHISYNDYVILSHNLLDQQKLSVRNRPVPYCMFTDPQLGRFGLTEKQAREQGYDIQVASMPMSYVARAVETGDTRGLMKAIVNRADQKIIGVAVLGEEGGELMTMLQLAVMGNLTPQQLSETVFAHPLYAESINNLFLQLAAQ